MKKFLLSIICAFSVILAACNEEKENTSSNPPEAQAKEADRELKADSILQSIGKKQLSKHEYKSRRCLGITDKELAIHLGCCTADDAAVFPDYCNHSHVQIQTHAHSIVEIVCDNDDVLRVARQRGPGLRHTYDKFLKQKPGFAGLVKVNFTIAPDGTVSRASVDSSTTGYAEFDNKIKDYVSRWLFKQVESDSTTAAISFTFSESFPTK